jgi:hypothetical protein
MVLGQTAPDTVPSGQQSMAPVPSLHASTVEPLPSAIESITCASAELGVSYDASAGSDVED